MRDFVDLLYAVAIVFVFISVITAAVSFGFLIVPLFFVIFMVLGIFAAIRKDR